MHHFSATASFASLALMGLVWNPTFACATDVKVLGVQKTSHGSQSVLLEIPDNAAVSAEDIASLVDAAGSQGRRIHGKNFGALAVSWNVPSPALPPDAPRKKRTLPAATPQKKRPSTPPALKKTPPAPAPAQPAKPDFILIDPAQPAAQPSPPPATSPDAPVPPSSNQE